jgi:hypothetical protein
MGGIVICEEDLDALDMLVDLGAVMVPYREAVAKAYRIGYLRGVKGKHDLSAGADRLRTLLFTIANEQPVSQACQKEILRELAAPPNSDPEKKP